MKKAHPQTLRFLIAGICALFAVTLLFIVLFSFRTQTRITGQNQQYLEDASLQSVKTMNEMLSTAAGNISMVSYLYELQLRAPAFDYRMLNEMTKPTVFDGIRFVSPEGVSFSGDGSQVNCKDREYYREGILGSSGICYLSTSRFTSHPVLIFYTPLYYNGEIIGVVNGVFETDKFAAQMETHYFGYEAAQYLCLRDGTIVASSGYDDPPDNVLDVFRSGRKVDASVLTQLQQALQDGQPYGFRYAGEGSSVGNAYLTLLEDDQFMLLQTFPPSASASLVSNANGDVLYLEIALIVIFLLFILSTSVYYIRKNNSLAIEKEDLSQIVDSVKQLYQRFVVFDFSNDSYQYLQAGNITTLGLPTQGKYSVWLAAFRAKNAEDSRLWGSMSDMEPSYLQRVLTAENWYTQREYQVPGQRWERLTLIRLDTDSPRTERVLGAVEDITETKQRDEASRRALEEAYHSAEAASNAKSDFLSRMSHDIRTPMNAIIGLTAIMGAHLDDRERIIDCLAKITTSSKHLLALINEVLDMSKIESGKLVLSEAEFSLSAFVDDLLRIIQPSVQAKQQHLLVQVSDVLHENVIGDSLRLQQVCVNILSNAVKYTPEGGHINISITEQPAKQSSMGHYCFVFQDDGIGMSQEFLQRIFSPFERAEDDRVSKIQGTGLGMSIAHSIMRLMGGDIRVSSEPGKGSRFTVDVNLRLLEEDEAHEERLVGLPVLVADDDQVACESTCLLLNDLGMNGEWVLTGRKALARVIAHRDAGEDFFAVILDWKMPGMDGLETAKAIRRQVGPDVPIIILSAYDWSEIESEARSAGVDAFIGKPLFKSRLRSVFVDLLAGPEFKTDEVLGQMKQADFSGKRVLLVEDNDINQEIAKEILEMSNLTVDVAENGRIAVDLFSASPAGYYDLILMDIQMPVMNGYDATRAIRALPRVDSPTVPIIAMTANTFNDDVIAALDAGMNQHIAKPLDMDQLLNALKKWLYTQPDADPDLL